MIHRAAAAAARPPLPRATTAAASLPHLRLQPTDDTMVTSCLIRLRAVIRRLLTAAVRCCCGYHHPPPPTKRKQQRQRALAAFPATRGGRVTKLRLLRPVQARDRGEKPRPA